MPDSLTPVIREEEFLSAIAGESTMPTPVIRREEFLAEIGNRVDGLAGDVEDLADIVPTPAAADSGKVLTAGADGTASWQTASGGGGALIIKGTGTATYDDSGSAWIIPADASAATIEEAFSTPTPVFVFLPGDLPTVSPYYSYTDNPSGNELIHFTNSTFVYNDIDGVEWSLYKNDGAYYILAVGGSN